MASVRKEWSVYLLVSGKRTYIGATTDVQRRLRQHNREIVGGAKATNGKQWQLVLWVSGFQGRSECYRWEKLAKLRAKGASARMKLLVELTHGVCPRGYRRNPGKYYQVPENLCLQIGSAT